MGTPVAIGTEAVHVFPPYDIALELVDGGRPGENVSALRDKSKIEVIMQDGRVAEDSRAAFA